MCSDAVWRLVRVRQSGDIIVLRSNLVVLKRTHNDSKHSGEVSGLCYVPVVWANREASGCYGGGGGESA